MEIDTEMIWYILAVGTSAILVYKFVYAPATSDGNGGKFELPHDPTKKASPQIYHDRDYVEGRDFLDEDSHVPNTYKPQWWDFGMDPWKYRKAYKKNVGKTPAGVQRKMKFRKDWGYLSTTNWLSNNNV